MSNCRILLCLLMIVAGCATVSPHQGEIPFDVAARAAIYRDVQFKTPHILLTIRKDGTMALAGRTITFEELKLIKGIEGLPSEIGVLMCIHRDTCRRSALDIVNELSRNGIWRISACKIDACDWTEPVSGDMFHNIPWSGK